MDNIFKSYNEIEWRTYETFYALRAFKQFWKEGERLIVNEAELNELLEGPQWAPKTPEEAAEHSAETRTARYLHDEVLSPTFRYSAVVMLFATFEREYRRFADNLANETNSSLRYTAFTGGVIEKIAQCIQRLKGFSPGAVPGYHQVRDLQKVRDCIVHCYGDVGASRDRAHLIKLGSMKRGIEVRQGDSMHVEPRFIEDAFDGVWTFFKGVFGKVEWRINGKWLA